MCTPSSEFEKTLLVDAEGYTNAPSGQIVNQERSFTLCRHVRFVGGTDGGTILDISADRFYNLNPTAAVMLRGLLDGESSERLAQRMAIDTAVKADQIESDLFSFAADLVARELVCKVSQ